MTTRRAVVVTLAAAIAVGGVMAGLAVGGVWKDGGSNEEPSAKQTVEAIGAAQQATAEAAVPPGITKEPFTPVPTPESCPIDPGMYRTEILGPTAHSIPATVTRDVAVVNQATGLSSQGIPYSIFSGASRLNPKQGAIAVWLGAKDPCAEGRVDYPAQEYQTPFEGGAVTLTQTGGDKVVFQAADGTIGRLNFVTGKFE